jgi:hypothetical protein
MCKRHPLGRGGTAWALARQLAATTRTAVVASATVQAFRQLTAMILSRDPICTVKERAPQRMAANWLSYSGCSGGTALPRRTQMRWQRGDRPAARWVGGDWSWNCAWAKKKQEHLMFLKIVSNRINSKLIRLQKLIWQDNWGSKNRFSRGKTSVFPRLSSKIEEYKR